MKPYMREEVRTQTKDTFLTFRQLRRYDRNLPWKNFPPILLI